MTLFSKFCLIGCCLATLSLQATDRPNIIFFVSDDHDFDLMPTAAFETIPADVAPTIDRLSRSGATFQNAYLTTSVCTPSRYTMLTGRYPGSSYSSQYKKVLENNSQGSPEFNLGVEDDGQNLAALLSKSGYRTGFVGKLHCSDRQRYAEIYAETPDNEKPAIKIPNEPRTLDITPAQSEAMYRTEKILRRYVVEGIGFDWAKHVYYGNTKAHNPAWTLDAALEFIDENKDDKEPFFLYYATTLVHGPTDWANSAAHANFTGEGIVDTVPQAEGLEPFSTIQQRIGSKYDEEVIKSRKYEGLAWIDASVRVMIDKLEQDGLLDNTIFVYVADNGVSAKSTLYEGGTRASMFIYYPKSIKPSVVLSDVSSADIAPTLLEMAEATVSDSYRTDGKSLVETFNNPTAEIHPEGVYSEIGMARSVVKDGWKYIAVRMPTWKAALADPDDPLSSVYRIGYTTNSGLSLAMICRYPNYFDHDQLYNLKDDPHETHNLATDPEYAAKLDEMKALLTTHLEAVGTPFGEFIPGSDTMEPSWEANAQAVASVVELRKGGAGLKGDPSGAITKRPSTQTHANQKALGLEILSKQAE
ncbi:sulfatase-like hydrolase/transferase [Ruficoccus sp. ZRK36]|uniref:sulfatase family protein n=1 Tax=Ruficoccus sp. ZRK36 TaxID=2866311 RepID=UPI001C73164E|nr:sulfatase-like hydrolase/transferase [Ruficoccus sp. ZRK36]QYY36884.1 sulfatase-like hydrolase/transferase [Ruficoccus sp. ZRK36]